VYPICIRVAAHSSPVCPRFPAAWSGEQQEPQALFKLKHWAERGHGLAGSLQLLSFIQLRGATMKLVDSVDLLSHLLQVVYNN